MLDLTNTIYTALLRHFANLSIFGYTDQKSTDMLLVLIELNDFIEGNKGQLVTESENTTLENVLMQICHICLVDYPVGESLLNPIVESTIINRDEDNILKLREQGEYKTIN